MTRVKFLANHEPRTAAGMKRYLSKLTKDGQSWNSIEVVDEGPCDLWLVINCPPGRNGWGTIGDSVEPFEPERTIVFQIEPQSTIDRYPSPFNRPHEHRELFYDVHDTIHHYNTLEWWLSYTYSQLNNGLVSFHKDRDLSAIVSSLYHLDGHKKRCDFVRYLSRVQRFDLYTRDPGWWQKPWWNRVKSKNVDIIDAGQLPKDVGLTRYRYHLAAENTREHNYFTEKIADPILAECLCFYWGSPNLERFIDPRAFIRVDLDDPRGAARTIQRAIQENEWERRLPYIRAAKQTILNKLQLFPTLEAVLARKESVSSAA